MFRLCYFYAIVCAKSYVISEKSEKIVFFKKASDTHIFYLFYYYISVFSSMHDRWNILLFYKMLDPSSE
jgi:hypothetical protein